MAEAKISDAHNSQTASLIWPKFGISKYLRVLISNIKSGVTLKFRSKETFGMITSENLEYSLTNVLLW